jgi:NTP pyrophosphatase (non-canonical NTP hydrolase)
MTDLIDIDQLKKILQDFAEAREWGQFHHPKNLAMALASETGELLEIFQWMSETEAKQARHDGVIKEKTSHELADIMLYLIRLADSLEINLSHALFEKLELNHQKYPADRVRGSAKKYTEY